MRNLQLSGFRITSVFLFLAAISIVLSGCSGGTSEGQAAPVSAKVAEHNKALKGGG